MDGRDGLEGPRAVLSQMSKQMLGGSVSLGSDPEQTRAPWLIVVDANLLRGEVIRLGRGRSHSALLSLASAGVIQLIAAQHVVDEVAEHLPEWCCDSKVDPVAAWAEWVQRLLPQIHVCSAPSELLAPTEAARIRRLSLEDPDDVPTATLILVTGARTLSRDKDIHRAVFDTSRYVDLHHNYLEALFAAGEVFTARTVGAAASSSTQAVGCLAVSTARWLSRAVGPGPLAVLAGIGVLAAGPSRAAKTAATLSEVALRGAAMVAGIAMVAAQAEKTFEAFPTPAEPIDLTEELAARRQEFVSALLDAAAGEK